ncbi:MAG: 23S rRNA pseudouridine(2604) synthase RluF [Saprospiraceae bacterium]|nr:23S rRNA pseudouridine(2604) synthase RluF [Saprospiraceae bacterium]
MEPNNANSVSLNKYIADTGVCSRREADKLIKAGKVKINGRLAISGNRVMEGDRVTLNGKPLREKPTPLYIAFHKPVGVVCTTDKREKDNIIDFINHPKRLFPIGRLDKASEGLIFLTNDGDIVNKILRAHNKKEKEYIVTVRQKITPDFIRKMSNGVPILDTVTKKCKVEQLSSKTFKIILTQGLNRQIRRMCEYFNYDVVKLLRVRIMHVHLGKLKVGTWRPLTPKELSTLHKALEQSTKTSNYAKKSS